MPELPEVEAARRAIEEHCIGNRIVKSMVADDTKVIDGVSWSDFESSVAGKTIVAAHRKGKHMWIQLDSPPFPSFQFGMTGAIYIKGIAVTKYKRSAVRDTDEWPSKYSKFFVVLDDGLEFSFTDKRRFAKVRLLDNPLSVPPISELGPDALLEPMALDEFQNSLKKKKIGIKALLLDQSFISGIGNWMADEVLYQAKIHPMQIASSISKESCGTLLKCINEVIEKALEVGADSCHFPSNWIFHYREKKPGKLFLDGKKIEFINAGGRITYCRQQHVPELQKLTGNQAIKGEVNESKVEKPSKKAKVVKGNNKNDKPSKTKKDSDSSSDDDDDEEQDSHIDSDEVAPKGKNQASMSEARDDDNEVHKRQSRRKTKRKEEARKDEHSDDEEASKAKTTSTKRRKAEATGQKGRRKGRAK